jgi:hypothetical protein
MSYGDLWQFVAVLTRVLNIVADSVGGWGGGSDTQSSTILH